ncbi:MAG: hypothetical protein ACOYB2_10505 [Limnohabitans sp.]
MGDKIAMARPGTQFSGDGLSLSWPKNRDGTPGIREVKEVPPGKRSGRVKRMLVDGAMVEVDLPTTAETPVPESNRKLYAGGSREALRRMREPAGPVVRQVFVPVGEVELQEIPTSVLEDDPERRPEEPEIPEDAFVAPAEPEPTFEERVDEMADSHTLATLQKNARAAGLKSADLTGKWGDKHALASAILTRQIAEDESTAAEDAEE